ncbi:hypothetical protein H311_00116 [Anncaliia algerae PRA109]|nr:hypothetical protein H311_00116 [Anncaliia algerae PRA109]
MFQFNYKINIIINSSMFSSQPKHLNTYILKIINLIKKVKRPFNYYEIKEELGINLAHNPGLIQSLKKNPRIEVKDNTLIYKPLYQIKSKEEFVDLLKESQVGILLSDLIDSNDKVEEWIKELGENVLSLKDADGSIAVFYNDLILNKAPKEVLNLYYKISVPNYTDMINELTSAGLKIHKAELTKKKPIPKSANKKNRRRIKITNTHIKGIDFQEEEK